jgi:hypothetical protein
LKIHPINTLFLTALVVFLSNSVSAQGTTAAKTDTAKTIRPQNVYVEVGAAGLFFSLNYDTRFTAERDGPGGRLGAGTWKSGSTTFVTVPFQLNYLIGGHTDFLELGAGATLLALNGTYNGDPIFNYHKGDLGTTVLPTTTIGYRHQPYRNGIDFGVSFNPMLLDGTFEPEFGASAGYTFR